MRYVLGTSAATVRAAPLLLVEALTEQGVVGRSYVFCYRRSGAKSIALLLGDAAELVRGDEVAQLAIAAKLRRRFDLIGVTGVVRMALSALDMAWWDALAVAANAPLARLLGGTLRPIRAYNSCGLGLTCDWLEYVDWTDAIAREPVKIANGCWPVNDRAGTGLDWDPDAIERYRIA